MCLIVVPRLPLRAAALPASTGIETLSIMRMLYALLRANYTPEQREHLGKENEASDGTNAETYYSPGLCLVSSVQLWSRLHSGETDDVDTPDCNETKPSTQNCGSCP